MGRAPTLRSLIELLDRVVGRGVVVDSDLPVSPALAGLRAAQAREESPTDARGKGTRAPELEPAPTGDDRRDPPAGRGRDLR